MLQKSSAFVNICNILNNLTHIKQILRESDGYGRLLVPKMSHNRLESIQYTLQDVSLQLVDCFTSIET